MDSGFKSLTDFGFLQLISKAQDSRFHKQKFLRFRNPDDPTKGDTSRISSGAR